MLQVFPELCRSDQYEPESWDTGAYWWDSKGTRHGPYNGGCEGYYKVARDGAQFKDAEPAVHPDQLALAI